VRADRIPVMIVGAGIAANVLHLPTWKRVDGVEVTAICDINRENAARTAKQWRIPRVYDDIHLLMKEEKEGIIDICTSPGTHVSLAERAMEAGYHVLIEKPLTMSVEETERILRKHSQRKERGKVCVVQSMLFEPPILEIRSILAAKRVDVLSIDIRMLHTPNDKYLSTRDHWVHSLPGGRFGESLIHPVYLIHNLMRGPMNVRDVFSVKRGSYEWVDFDELNVALDNGTVHGSIHISFNSPRWTYAVSLRIYGKEAILHFDGTNLTSTVQGPLMQGWLPGAGMPRWNLFKDSLSTCMSILMCTGKNGVKALSHTWGSGFFTLLRLFVNAVAEDGELPYSFQESCEANKTFLEILRHLANNVEHR